MKMVLHIDERTGVPYIEIDNTERVTKDAKLEHEAMTYFIDLCNKYGMYIHVCTAEPYCKRHYKIIPNTTQHGETRQR